MPIFEHLSTPLTSLSEIRQRMALLQQMLLQKKLTLRSPPPEPTSCCGRGCNGCVWESFYTALHYWQADALTLLQAATSNEVKKLAPPPVAPA